MRFELYILTKIGHLTTKKKKKKIDARNAMGVIVLCNKQVYPNANSYRYLLLYRVRGRFLS